MTDPWTPESVAATIAWAKAMAVMVSVVALVVGFCSGLGEGIGKIFREIQEGFAKVVEAARAKEQVQLLGELRERVAELKAERDEAKKEALAAKAKEQEQVNVWYQQNKKLEAEVFELRAWKAVRSEEIRRNDDRHEGSGAARQEEGARDPFVRQGGLHPTFGGRR